MEILDWFEEKIEARKKQDMELFQEAIADLATVVQGEKALAKMLLSDRKKTTETIEQVFHFFHIRPGRLQMQEGDFNEQLERALRPYGIMRRDVKLREGWYRQAAGAYLGFTKEGEPTALLPQKRGYAFFNYGTGKWEKISQKNWREFSDKAVCFYKPLPMKPVGAWDLLKFCGETLDAFDCLCLVLSFLAVSLAGLMGPYITWNIFGQILPKGNKRLLAAAAFALAGASLSNLMFSAARAMSLGRCSVKVSVSVDAAVMGRVVSLPAEFFREYNAGELAKRIDSISEAVKDFMNVAVWFGLSMACSLVYMVQIRRIAPELFPSALWIYGIVFVINGIGILYQVKMRRQQLYTKSKTAGMEYALYSGIQKLKVAGAERRAFSNWAKLFKKHAQVSYCPPFFLKIVPALTSFAVYIGWAVLFAAAAKAGAGRAEFMAFCSSWLLMSGAFLNGWKEIKTLPEAVAAFHMAKPILQEMPEHSKPKERVANLAGGIELSHVTFRYAEQGPDVVRNLSMKIRPGQYVGIVGKTGCGKSTLFRLLLGFEKPRSGAVYYDRKDIQKLDLTSLRQKIGSVLQDGFLFDGDILSNITIAAPWLGLEDAWEAARIAGIAEDIQEMPMGMFTMVSEGSGTISGGQKQRILIARAIVSKPKILMFDEATSALDNLSQRKVSEALERMKCTRIVIAHRLSTIQDCDKIFVMEEGRIAEEGKYEDLIKKDGIFAELVKRQRLA